jgi:hypothetical protein
VAGCNSPTNQEAKATEETVTALQPGEYELAWSAIKLDSTDHTTPATKAGASAEAAGAAFPARACVAAGGAIDPVAFAEKGDECRTENSYVRNGKINVQLNCGREGNPGPVMQVASGTFTADAFKAEVATTTYFTGAGDYAMTRSVTARRVGECAAKGA